MLRRLTLVVLVPALVAVTGCGTRTELFDSDGAKAEPASTQTPTPTPIPTPTPTPVPRAPNPFEVGSVWSGTYTCAQGLTDLVLTIVAVKDDVVKDAIFAFDWDGAVRGSFHMSATFVPADRTAVFRAGAWIERPPQWQTVGMKGTVNANSTEFSGMITTAQCGSFELFRDR